jgi:hypothetical protein
MQAAKRKIGQRGSLMLAAKRRADNSIVQTNAMDGVSNTWSNRLEESVNKSILTPVRLKTWEAGASSETEAGRLKSEGVMQISPNSPIMSDILGAFGLQDNLHPNFRETSGREILSSARDYDEGELTFAIVQGGKTCQRLDCSVCFDESTLKTKRGF